MAVHLHRISAEQALHWDMGGQIFHFQDPIQKCLSSFKSMQNHHNIDGQCSLYYLYIIHIKGPTICTRIDKSMDKCKELVHNAS